MSCNYVLLQPSSVFQEAILKYNPPTPAERWRTNAALPLRGAGDACHGWTRGVPRQADGYLRPPAAKLCSKSDILSLCAYECVGGGGWGRGGGSAALWHPGCRPSITDVGTGGSCLPILLAEEKLLQMATASRERTAKPEEFMTEIMERKRKKHFQCTRFIFSVKEKPVIKWPDEQLHYS